MNLNRIFEHQAVLIARLNPVEVANGYTPTTFPVEINTRQGQDALRAMAWWLTEEIAEAQSARFHEYAEELSDVFHFAVELALMAGVSPDDVLHMSNLDMFDDAPPLVQLSDVQLTLGKAINKLKMKPWKQNPKHTDVHEFKYQIALMTYQVIQIIKQHQLNPETLYFHKNEINHTRISSGV